MLAEEVFFSFAEVLDPTRHRDYNAWHQLDHRPENLALPGVQWGERWVRSPDCAAAGIDPVPELAGTHYVNMYWFTEPAAESIREWQRLAERSFQWGRRPEGAYATRPLMGFFMAVKGYVAPRVRVSPDALPFRPNRGVHIVVYRLREPHSAAAEEVLAWYDRVHMPDVVACPGVAGAWTFSSVSTTLDAGWEARRGSTTFDPGAADPGRLRVAVIFVDEDPLVVASRLVARREDWARAGRTRDTSTVEDKIFASPLRTIVPWQWDWFDEAGDHMATATAP